MKREDFSKVAFKEKAHFTFEDEYIGSYVSTNVEPTVYMSVNTPRKDGFAAGYGKHWFTIDGEWLRLNRFMQKYGDKIRLCEEK